MTVKAVLIPTQRTEGALPVSQATCHQLTLGCQAGVFAMLGQFLHLPCDSGKLDGP